MLKRYSIPRFFYHRLLKPELIVERRERQKFFSQFVASGELAFDVGAFKGEVTEALAASGAQVVAIEPNPSLASELRKRFRVHIEEVAVGSESGQANLKLGCYSGHSTLSTEWSEIAGADRFMGEIAVDVTTLDELIRRYEVPSFIKIDVEGHEAAVVGGLSTPVRSLSYEFQSAALDVARRTTDKLLSLGNYEFNATFVEQRRFVAPRWTSCEQLWRIITAYAKENPTGYGDVYARLPGP